MKEIYLALGAFSWVVATARVFDELHTSTLSGALFTTIIFWGGACWIRMALPNN